MKAWPAITPLQVNFSSNDASNTASFSSWEDLVQKKIDSRPKQSVGLSRRSTSTRKTEPQTTVDQVSTPVQNVATPVVQQEFAAIKNKAWLVKLNIRNGKEQWVEFENLNGLYDTPEQDPFLENVVHQYFFPVEGKYLLMYRPLEAHAAALVNAGVHLDPQTQKEYPELNERWSYLTPTAQRSYLAPDQ